MIDRYPINITSDIQTLLRKNVPVAIGVSGGKDSHVVAFLIAEYLREIKHTGPLILIHSDLGRIEWKDSAATCERIARDLGLNLEVVRRRAGDLIDRFETRWMNNIQRYQTLSLVKLVLPWATPKMRFCTGELKLAVIASRLRKLFPKQSIISASGIRAAESPGRARKPVSQIQAKLSGKGFTGWDCYPIHSWTTEDVFEYLSVKGETLHEAYTQHHCTRVSCAFCIMSSLDDLKAAARCSSNEGAFRLLVDLEIRSTFAFQGSRWLGGVAPHLLSPEKRDALAEAKEKARRRAEVESLIPAHMLFTKGWPESVPSFEEASLLADVRQTVCEIIGIQPTFTDPREIITRYESLIAEKQSGKTGELFESAA